MPICFVAIQPMGGCIERVVVSGPFFMMNPSTRQFLLDQNKKLIPDITTAWNWASQWAGQQQMPLAPGGYKPYFIADSQQPVVVAVQTTVPAVQNNVQINAPFNSPVGNPGVMDELPVQRPREQCRPNADGCMDMDMISNAALPRNSDPLMGEIDGAGGTFTELNSNGVEETRTGIRPFPPNPALGGRG